MLELPRPANSRARQSERKRRYRDRQRRGVVCPRGVEVSAVGLDFLIETHWLREADATDLAQIGRAITAMIEDSGKRR
jgi:hypothetical protein